MTRARLVVAAIGVAVWAWGYRIDDSRLRWAGMILLLVSIVLRFLDRPRDRTDS